MFEDKWNLRFLNLAKFIAQWSKDPGCKVGAVIIRPDKSICSVGFNGFPQGIEDSPEILNNRDKKLKKVIHAEENAFAFSSDQSLKGYAIATWPFPPCEKCAGLIIQNKIQYIIAPNWIPNKWKESCEEGFRMFADRGKEVILYSNKDIENEGLQDLLKQ